MVSFQDFTLLLQTTIFFTIVSQFDDFVWQCKPSVYLSDNCYSVHTLNQTGYAICTEGGETELNVRIDGHGLLTTKTVYPTTTGVLCGDRKLECDDFYLSSLTNGTCGNGCTSLFSTQSNDTYCICGIVQTGDYIANIIYQKDSCYSNYNGLFVAVMVCLILYLGRLLAYSYCTGFIFLKKYRKSSKGAKTYKQLDLLEKESSYVWTNPKINTCLLIVDIIQSVILGIVVGLLNLPPEGYCTQQKQFTARALIILCALNAATSLVYTITFIYTILVLKLKVSFEELQARRATLRGEKLSKETNVDVTCEEIKKGTEIELRYLDVKSSS